jgi:Zn-dependent protease
VDGRSGFEVASIRGFDVRVDASWFILFFLILWSLSAGTFPAVAPGLGAAVYLAMGVVGALLFFASILLHELAHSVVAQSRGIGIRGITLFVFGGVAHTLQEPRRAEDELVIAGIGPVVSFGLGAAFLLLAAVGRIVGTLPLSRLQRTPRDEWSATPVAAVMSSLDRGAVVRPDTEMSEVLERIRSAEDGQILVMDDESVVGSISRSDLARLAERARAVVGR